MQRRIFLTLALGAALSAPAAFAQSFTDSVVDQLRRQGFSRITVQRTFLGRTQIVALGKGGQREIIVNPRTGEILRDLWTDSGGDSSGPESRGGLISDDDSGKGRGRGKDDGDKDDDKDQDDDKDKEDDSGKDGGGSNSGSGGGDDGDDDE